MLDKKFFKSLSSAMRKDYVKHIFENCKDIFGNWYWGYEEQLNYDLGH